MEIIVLFISLVLPRFSFPHIRRAVTGFAAASDSDCDKEMWKIVLSNATLTNIDSIKIAWENCARLWWLAEGGNITITSSASFIGFVEHEKKDEPSLFVFHQMSWIFMPRSIRLTNNISHRASGAVSSDRKFIPVADIRNEVKKWTPAENELFRVYLWCQFCFCSLVS